MSVKSGGSLFSRLRRRHQHEAILTTCYATSLRIPTVRMKVTLARQPAHADPRGPRAGFPWVKAGVTFILLVLIFSNIDRFVIAQRLSSAKVGYIFLGIVLLMANVVLVGMRWWFVLRRLGFRAMSPGFAIATTFAAAFVGQISPGTMGSDAMRGWLSYKKGAWPSVAISSLFADRLLALLGLLLVVGVGWLWKLERIDRGITIQVMVLGGLLVTIFGLVVFVMPAIIGLFAGWWGRLRKLQDMLLLVRQALLSRAGAIGVGLSCAIQVLTVWAVLFSARGFGIELKPIAAYLIVPLTILASTVPITIAGWGVREASLSGGLTLFGVPSEDGMLLALTLGLGLVIASLPGGIIIQVLDLGYWRGSKIFLVKE
jgi:uncharacterized membrane protein YbhN (UPF0104 family)